MNNHVDRVDVGGTGGGTKGAPTNSASDKSGAAGGDMHPGKHIAASSSTKANWRSRIVDSGEVAPGDLLPNPRNWRSHPQDQQAALAGVLSEVGWVQQVVVNRRTGHLLDGHLRVGMAIQRKEARVPALFVDLSEQEEALVLATLDPLSAMASTDQDKLGELLAHIEVEEEAVQAMLAKLAEDAGITPPRVEFEEYDESAADEVEYIQCPSCGFRWAK